MEWVPVNEVTETLVNPTGRVFAWAMRVNGSWYGRVREGLFPNVGEEMSFGPTTLSRARLACEAFLRREPFEKVGRERSWRGNCLALL
jgi:hypothetical protein